MYIVAYVLHIIIIIAVNNLSFHIWLILSCSSYLQRNDRFFNSEYKYDVIKKSM